MTPYIIFGDSHLDKRGQVFFNNEFDASIIKRIYFIENHSVEFVRGWQGHKIEKRWFSAIQGAFNIRLIAIDDWNKPSFSLPVFHFTLNSGSLDVLNVPAGYVSSIQALQEKSRLLVMSDYFFGEIDDLVRLDLDYFNINK